MFKEHQQIVLRDSPDILRTLDRNALYHILDNWAKFCFHVREIFKDELFKQEFKLLPPLEEWDTTLNDYLWESDDNEHSYQIYKNENNLWFIECIEWESVNLGHLRSPEECIAKFNLLFCTE